MDRRVASDELRRRLRRSRRGVALRLVVQLDDLRARHVGRRLAREAHHEDGAQREVRSVEAWNAALAHHRVDSRVVEARRADDTGKLAFECGGDVRLDGVGCREVHHRLCSVELDELVPLRFERGSEDATNLPPASVEGELHAARASADGLIRRAAARKTRSLGPIPEIESFSGAKRRPASSATWSASTASSSAMIRSKESSSVSVMSDLPSRVMRFDVDSIESMMRPLRFSFARASSW